MTEESIERNLGEQPIAAILTEAGLKPHDLVAASPVPMTHKMVGRACKGRRLTLNTQMIVLNALQAATGKTYSLSDLFTYADATPRLPRSQRQPASPSVGQE